MDNNEAMNLDDNMMVKGKSLLESLPGDIVAIQQYYLVTVKRLANLYLLLKAKCNQIST
jgi:hypothetical protein